MRRVTFHLLSAIFVINLIFPAHFASEVFGRAQAPKLTVLITVDQLRGDLLERYDRAFTGGFRRLMDNGFRYAAATADHAPTNSYPGHVTIATGAFPARHGIIDNSWAEEANGRLISVGGAIDNREKIVGFPALPGVSPGKLLVTGLPDWYLQQNPKSVVACISSNEYGSLLHAGKSRGHVYWFSPAAGRFVTSTYYRSDYPAWVERFNTENLPQFLKQSIWENTVPEKFKDLSLPDGIRHEFDGVNTVFPHVFEKESGRNDSAENITARADWFYFSPFADAAALSLAREAVLELKLGRDKIPDYLSVTLGSTDGIGHRFGPLSAEQFDNLLRLDRELGDFFDFLDRKVGAANYVVALTADHGASDIPEWQKDQGGVSSALRVAETDMDDLLGAVSRYEPKQSESPEKKRADIAAIAEKYKFVGDAITQEDLAGKENPNEYLQFYRNSFRPERTPIYPIVSRKFPPLVVNGIRIRLAENSVPFFAPSNHGTPYFYDRHVPIIFMGRRIKQGISRSKARTVDIAPTLAKLSGINIPVEIDGKPLGLKRLLINLERRKSGDLHN
jgi:predicted AlkP superfamily pyrophosphatase or phosphodiesterase